MFAPPNRRAPVGPACSKQRRQTSVRAFSDEVEAGSSSENAPNEKIWSIPRMLQQVWRKAQHGRKTPLTLD
jgi:hypothetical protein